LGQNSPGLANFFISLSRLGLPPVYIIFYQLPRGRLSVFQFAN
jgi:hypothetical protein